MTAYIIATVRIRDLHNFAIYGKAICMCKAQGGLVRRSRHSAEVLEGSSPVGKRVTATRFADSDAARLHPLGKIRSGRIMREGPADIKMGLLIT